MSAMSPHEVVRLHRQKMEHGFNVLQEFSFTEDHAIFQRLTIVQDDGKFESLAGWQKIPFEWPDIRELMRVIFKKERQGYAAVWGKGYGPEPNAFDYCKTVTW